MGWVLVIISSISIFGYLIFLFSLPKILNQLAGIFEETNTAMPFWTRCSWVFILFFIIINLTTILFGRFLIKNPEQNKKYLPISIFLLVLILLGFPLLLQFLIMPVMLSIYEMGQIK